MPAVSAARFQRDGEGRFGSVGSPFLRNCFRGVSSGLFGREKVTKVVWQDYKQKMYGCQRYGSIRRNGFLYLENDQEIQFRGPGDIERDIKQIAPEELAAGMLEILKQNVTAGKNGLYRSLVSRRSINRVGKTINMKPWIPHYAFSKILLS